MPGPPKPSPAEGFPWTARQRRGIVVCLSLFTAVLAGRYACNPEYIEDPAPDKPARSAELADRLDPNVAAWQELAAITGLGEKKARAIVSYRENWHVVHPRESAFRDARDLQHVKGIGAATAANLQPYLIFPDSPRSAADDAKPPDGPDLMQQDDDTTMQE